MLVCISLWPWGGLRVSRAASQGCKNPSSNPEPPELGWGEPGAQVRVVSPFGGKFSTNWNPGVTSQYEPDCTPGHTASSQQDAVTKLSPSSCPCHGKSISVMVFGWMRSRDQFPLMHGDPTVAHVQDRGSGDSDTSLMKGGEQAFKTSEVVLKVFNGRLLHRSWGRMKMRMGMSPHHPVGTSLLLPGLLNQEEKCFHSWMDCWSIPDPDCVFIPATSLKQVLTGKIPCGSAVLGSAGQTPQSLCSRKNGLLG
nr:uncharacterized protein LOC110355583 [Columba livia]